MDPSQPPNANNAGTSSSTDSSMGDSALKYTPQFSAATEMILKRINSGTSSASLGPIGNTGLLPGYDDMRRAVMSSMKTSMNMELPALPSSRRNQGERASVGSVSSAGATNAARTTPAGTPKPRGRDKNGTPASGGKGKGGVRGSARGKKRKRAREETDESSSESAAMSDLGDESDTGDEASIPEDNFPKVTQSGRTIVKPTHFIPTVSDTPPKKKSARKSQKNVENALCKRCGRGHSPNNNQMTFCDGCQLGWHQMCHDPVIKDEYVKDVDAPWYCADCTRKRASKKTAPIPAQQATPNLAAAPTPPPVTDHSPEQSKLVSWQGSDAEKYAYLCTLRQPQLVNLVYQATFLEPNLPIFPAVIKPQKPSTQASVAPQTAQPLQPSPFSNTNTSNNFTRTTAVFHSHPPALLPASAPTGGLFNRAEANPNGTMNFIRKIPPGQHASPPAKANSPSLMQPPRFAKTSSASPTLPQPSGFNSMGMDGGDDSRESTPASPPYPKAGNGLMSKLGPDDEDIEWLEDENDSFAFSGNIYDEQMLEDP